MTVNEAEIRAAIEAGDLSRLQALDALAAVEPLIRERLAQEVEAMTPMVSDEWPTTGNWVAQSDAARIVRGAAS